ncbi:MAG: hypothetical protein FJ303_07255 [Planctomycetes bacterium]|nr:hypothetical protein [Planctomycetota bacterium]
MLVARPTAIVLVIGVAGLTFGQSADTHQAARQTLVALADQTIDAKPFKEPMPLAKFLDAVQTQMPTDKRLTLRVDNLAYGDTVKDVLATPVSLFPGQSRVSVMTALDRAIAKIKLKSDFRIDGTQVTITTYERASFAIDHDIRDATAKPESVGLTGAEFRAANQAQRAASLVKRLAAVTELTTPFTAETIEVINGTRLAVRTVGTRHAEFLQAIRVFARLADLVVTTQCKLYEVDDAFYSKLKNAKRASIEEEERIFLEGNGPKVVPLDVLMSNQKLVVTGDDVTVDNGQSATLLARQTVQQCSAGPEQVRKGDKARQFFITGFVVSGAIRVSPDRRYIRIELGERTKEVDQIRKVKVLTEQGLRIVEEPGKGQRALPPVEVVAETPVFHESTHLRVLDVPDGGTRLVPLYFRPRSLEEKNAGGASSSRRAL